MAKTSIFSEIGYGTLALFGAIVTAVIGLIAIFFFVIFGALVGAVTGWIISIAPILGNLVTEGFASIGIKNPNLVAIGAMLGFVAGFFKPHLENRWNCMD